jgi:predicted permease
MKTLRTFFLRIRNLFRKDQLDQELSDELKSHLEMHIEDNLRSGMTPEEARREALLKLGGVEQSKESVRDHRGLPFLETLLQDLRYGLRMLRKNLGFTAIAVLTLALGIGANSGIFSVMRQVLLQRLPVPHPEQLVLLYAPGPRSGHVSSDEGDGTESFTYPMYKYLQDNNTVFAGLAAKANFPISASFRGATERANAELVSGNYFTTLEVQATLGRVLLPDDASAPGSNPVVVLGYGYWKKRFGSDTGILNQSLLVNNQLMTVVGVVQPGFDGIQLGLIPDVYLPITMKPVITPGWSGLTDHKDYWIKLIARLKPGILLDHAATALAPTYHALLVDDLAFNTRLDEKKKAAFVAKKLVLREGARGRPILENGTRPQLLALMGMVGLVLFITCANVAGLLTARGAARQKEISVRLSLGASRWRLVRQLVIESCMLSAVGATLGLVIAGWMSNALVHFASTNQIADGLSGSLDGSVLIFTAALALLSGILFGVIPALNATRVQISYSLKEQGGAVLSAHSQARLRKVLVISQVALTLLLVTSACGFVRSLYNLKNVDLGLQPAHVLQFSVAPQLNGYDEPRSLALYQRLEDRVAALPGVQSLSAAQEPLIAYDDRGSNVTVEGEPAELSGTRDVLRNAVGPSHFSNLRIPLIRGREFTRQDGPNSPKAVIINATMAKEFFPNGDAIGRHMKFGGGSDPLDKEIVGIVQDSHHSSIDEKPKAFVYVPYPQEKGVTSLTYYVRTAGDPVALASSVRQAISELDGSLPIYDVRSFDEQIELQLSSSRLVALLALIFGSLAALLAAMGIYGLLAYTVTQRTREIGVRMALGAEPKRVGWMIFSDVARLTGIGILLGIPLAYVLGKLINSMLYGVQAFGFSSVGIALLALATVAAFAAFIPARRATRIDPMIALRYE